MPRTNICGVWWTWGCVRFSIPVWRLETLIKRGKEYVFISNIDNLSATIDLKILYHIMQQECEFCMEVTCKNQSRCQRGTLVEYDGKFRLVELAEVDKSHVADFYKFDYFNTNNLWVNLRGIQRLIAPGALCLTSSSTKKFARGQEGFTTRNSCWCGN